MPFAQCLSLRHGLDLHLWYKCLLLHSHPQAREARGLALAPDRMSTGERALVGAVLGTPVTQVGRGSLLGGGMEIRMWLGNPLGVSVCGWASAGVG